MYDELNYRSLLDRQGLSFKQVVDLGGDSASPVVLNSPHFSVPIGEQVLLGSHCFSHSIHDFSSSGDGLFRLDPVVVRIDSVGLDVLAVVDLPPAVLFVHHSV